MDIVGQSYFGTLLSMLPDLLSFVISLGLLCYLSVWMAAFVVAFTLIQMVVPKVMSPKIAKAKAALSQQAAAFTEAASEHLQGYDLLKGFHLTARSLQALRLENHIWEEKRFRAKLLSSVAMLLSFGLGQIIYIGIYFIGALLVVSGHLTLGGMIAATQLSVYIASPLQTLSGDIAEVNGAKQVIAALEATGSKQEAPTGQEKPQPPYPGISMDHVSFSYGDAKIFDDVSFTFLQGKKYRLSGASGTGKTTLTKLLTGALTPDSGTVRLGELPISQIDPAFFAQVITTCAQSNFIFNDTLRNNVTLFQDRYSDEQVLDALHRAGFDYVLQRYPQGLDQTLDQAGQNLSGGERQRIALARILLLGTPFVILDESFANLDSETAQELTRLMTSEPERTLLFIGHQLAPEINRYFDICLDIKDKKLQERETEHELAATTSPLSV